MLGDSALPPTSTTSWGAVSSLERQNPSYPWQQILQLKKIPSDSYAHYNLRSPV